MKSFLTSGRFGILPAATLGFNPLWLGGGLGVLGLLLMAIVLDVSILG